MVLVTCEATAQSRAHEVKGLSDPPCSLVFVEELGLMGPTWSKLGLALQGDTLLAACRLATDSWQLCCASL